MEIRVEETPTEKLSFFSRRMQKILFPAPCDRFTRHLVGLGGSVLRGPPCHITPRVSNMMPDATQG